METDKEKRQELQQTQDILDVQKALEELKHTDKELFSMNQELKAQNPI